MHRIVFRSSAVCIALCAAGLSVVGALLNWEGAAMMAPGEAAVLMSTAAVLAEPLKLVWLSGFREALRLKAGDVALAVLVMGVFLHAFSMTAAIGLAGAGRMTTAAGLAGEQDKAARARHAYDEARARVERLRGQRDQAAVERDLVQTRGDLGNAEQREAVERKVRKGRCSTPECTRAASDAASARERVKQLDAELVLSRQADEARRDADSARSRLDAVTAPPSTDPQAEALAGFLPLLSSQTISKALPLLPSLLVEFTPPVAMLLAVLFWQAGGSGRREIITPSAMEQTAQQEALDRVRAIILSSPGRRLVASVNALADSLGVSRSTFHEWVAKWQAAGHITVATDRRKTVIELRRKAAA